MSDTLLDKAQRAAAALEELRRAAVEESGNRPAPGPAPAAGFSLTWEAGMSAAALAEAALEAAAETAVETGVFRPGHPYCYHCRSAACAHATAPGPGMVFAGYSSLGQPQWEELLSLLLALEDRRAERLYRERPDILAQVVDGERLSAAQLVSFGRHSLAYRPWGEVVAGYFRVGESKAALTAQVVETAGRRLCLQLLAPPALRECLADTPADRRSPFHRAFDALQEARRRIDALSPLWAAGRRLSPARRDRLRQQAADVLRHLARSLERQGRQEHRRTLHAETRTAVARPVHAALEDLAGAAAADFYRDAFRGSVIVLGRSGRCHVFSDAGRHITTLSIGRDELEGRLRRKRYLPLPAPELAAFRRALAGSDDAAPPPPHPPRPAA
jgi:hypothetical protein